MEDDHGFLHLKYKSFIVTVNHKKTNKDLKRIFKKVVKYDFAFSMIQWDY